MISGRFGKSRCHELQSGIPVEGPEGLAAAGDEVGVDPRRGDGFEVKWGRGLEEMRDGDEEGKFTWHGTISPG